MERTIEKRIEESLILLPLLTFIFAFKMALRTILGLLFMKSFFIILLSYGTGKYFVIRFNQSWPEPQEILRIPALYGNDAAARIISMGMME